VSTNLELWEKVCKTDPKHTKEVAFGRKFTSVDAQYQIKNATIQWGVFGITWGVKEEKFTQIHLGEKDSVVDSSTSYHYCVYTAKLFYPEGETEIHSDIEVIFSSGKRIGDYNDDWTKKVATDALTKGLSKLGFNSDVFEGRFDDKYYVLEMNENFGNIPKGKMPQRITPEKVKELQAEIDLRTVDTEKLIEYTNNKFGTEVHYDYILRSVKAKKVKENNNEQS